MKRLCPEQMQAEIVSSDWT